MNLFVLAYPTYNPLIHAFPEVWGYIPVKTDIKVVFPAPFGPSKPKIYFYFNPMLNGFSAT